MTTPEELRERAEQSRQMASSLSDQFLVKAFYELAAEYEGQAGEMERREEEPPTS